MHIHNFYLSDDGVVDVDGVTADARINGPRTESQRTNGVGQANNLGRRGHGRPLQVAGSAVARPTTAVARGGRGMLDAPRGESGSTGAGTARRV